MLGSLARVRPLAGLAAAARVRPVTLPSLENKTAFDYERAGSEMAWHRNRLLTIPERFEPISTRRDISDYQLPQVKGQAKGVCLSNYRGFPLLKTALDLGVYSQLLQELRPRSVIELGTFCGASALWLDDTLRVQGTDCQIYSLDWDVSLREREVEGLVSERVTFLEGDVKNVKKLFPRSFLLQLPRPLLVIEDVHVCLNEIITHFNEYLSPGDYLVFEKTNPMLGDKFYMGERNPQLYRDRSVVGVSYSQMGKWKLEYMRDFFAPHGDFYAVDTFFTDLFGYNCSSQMNSIFRRMI